MLRFTDHIFVNQLVCSWIPIFCIILLPSSNGYSNLSAGMAFKICFWSSLFLLFSLYLFVSRPCICVRLFVYLSVYSKLSAVLLEESLPENKEK